MAALDQKPTSKGQAWFCTTGLPSDVVIEVDDMNFHLHMFPLMSKSRKLHDLITEQETNPSYGARDRNPSSGDGDGDGDDDDGRDEIEEVECYVVLAEFPGGSEAFEAAAKFCYGVKIDLTAANVAETPRMLAVRSRPKRNLVAVPPRRFSPAGGSISLFPRALSARFRKPPLMTTTVVSDWSGRFRECVSWRNGRDSSRSSRS